MSAAKRTKVWYLPALARAGRVLESATYLSVNAARYSKFECRRSKKQSAGTQRPSHESLLHVLPQGRDSVRAIDCPAADRAWRQGAGAIPDIVGAFAGGTPLGISSRGWHAGGAFRERVRTHGGVGLSAEAAAGLSFAISCRRASFAGGVAGADSGGAAGIEHDRFQRRHVHGARDVFRAGGRTGSGHRDRRGNRNAAGSGGQLRA